MRIRWLKGRYAVACGVSCLVAMVVSPALADESSSGASMALSSGPLVIVGSPEEGSQLQAERQARVADPELATAREASRTKYAGAGSAVQSKVALDAFASLLSTPLGGMPSLPGGERIGRYLSAHAATVDLPEGRQGVVESLQPIAVERAGGGTVPIDLRPKEAGGVFEPSTPPAGLSVRIPARLSDGVSLASAGVSLTPVDEHGASMGGDSGAVLGASVFYGSTGTDSAVAVQPTSFGFDLQTLIYSASAPETYLFRVGVPAGAALAQDSSGVVRVTEGGRPVAAIEPTHAQDAEGTSIPTSLSLTGDVLAVRVEHRAGSYLYPVLLDPEVNDSQLATTGGGKRSNWEFHTSNSGRFAGSAVYEGVGKEHLETKGIAEYLATEWAFWGYETKGNSKIYELKTKTSAKNKGSKIESFLEFEAPGGVEKPKKLLSTELQEPEYSEKTTTICAWNASKVEECLPGAGKEKNSAHFQQSATASPGGSYGFWDSMSEGIVSISEPAGTHATTGFNTTSPEVEGEVEVEGKKILQKRLNVLYGSGGWLTKYQGALEPIAKDAGIGVAAADLEYERTLGTWERLYEHSYLEKENGCQGVQCYAEHKEYWTLDPKLPDGEDRIRYRAEEAMSGTASTESEGRATVKVDTAAPRNITLNGLPWGNELAEKPYKLTAEATDGTGTAVASSGVKSIKLFVSGREIAEVGKQAGCSVAKGECTATAEWSLNGAELGAGHHAIAIVTVDNAGNEARLQETISIRHSTPVALGPGSVDLESGDFALGATDVSMGSGLTVSRNYSSRDLTQGLEGPLGPQWSLGLSSSESLTEMVDGSVLVTAANGSQSIFASLGGGKFETPTGDSNLRLTLEENKETKQKFAYYLENAADRTKVKFTLPGGGTKMWVPTRQEGTVSTDTVTYAYQTVAGQEEHSLPLKSSPAGIVVGPDKNLWFTDAGNGNIGEVTPAGVLTEYSTMVNEKPVDIAAGPEGFLFYVDEEKHTIVKITTEGVVLWKNIAEFGSHPSSIVYGPSETLWFTESAIDKIGKTPAGSEGHITQYSVPTGSVPESITVGPNGNLWYTEYGSNKIGEMTPSGTIVTEFSLPAGSGPLRITVGPNGNVWYTDYTSNKIGKIVVSSGSITEYSLPAGSKPAGITAGGDNDIWFTDEGTSRIGKINTAGVSSEYPLSSGSGPMGVVAGPDGRIWYTENSANSVSAIPTSGVITEPTEVLAPVPANVSCSPMKAGCRALKFQYATETTAKGENRSEWGEYKHHLSRVLLSAYNPASKAMQETTVAEYSFDKAGRLRAEWDPRISPALKTTFGYDKEGHVTALTSPGEESWAFTYGTIVGDSGTGRLLKTKQASASTELWNGEAPENIKFPIVEVEGEPYVGVRLAVSMGQWSPAPPLSISYQWKRCNGEETVCTRIPGANNANYTVTSDDWLSRLVVEVTATNGGGSRSVWTGAKGVVQMPKITEYSSGSSPVGIAAGPDGNLWFTDSNKIGKITTSGTVTEYSLLSAFGIPHGIASGPDGNLWFTDRSLSRIGRITTSGVVTEFSLPGGSEPYGIAAGPDGNLWFTDEETNKIGKITTSGAITEYALPSGSRPVAIASGSDGDLWFTDQKSSKIGKITTSGTITEYALPAESKPTAIASGPDNNLWFTDERTSKIGKITTSGAIVEFSLLSFGEPRGIVAGPDGNLWFTDRYSSKIGKITTSGAVVAEYALPSGSQPFGITAGSDKNLWFAEENVSKIGKIATSSEGTVRGAQPGATMEYGVPLSEGSGRPSMTSTEVAKWGQKDIPVEASAIVPPDSPQGWPASDYTRASVYYLDGRGRLTNTSTPSTAPDGSISTTEYNEENDVIRTLSPDNRQTALEAGSKSVEVAKLLDTQNTYNGEGAKELEVSEPGTRLIDTLGPQHMVKYMAGKEMKESLARNHIKFFYDEGAPAGETYDLLTKKTDLAQLANEEEVEVRKTTTSYSGQENLGWKLRAPTSVVDDPEGKKTTSTTLYNAVTGQIVETRGPAGQAGNSAHDVKIVYYSSQENTEGYPGCGLHPEWSGLVCETLPAKQPETPGPPKLPVTTTIYNIWNEPETVTEAFGTIARTKKYTYDEAGRLTSSETTSTSTEDQALPKLTDEYNSKTGVLEKQSTTVEGKTKTITSVYNTLGQLTSYTDADGNVAKYAYASIENGGLLEEMTDSSNGGSRQTFAYNTTTKQLEKLWDSAAETFTATYDAEGKMTSEVYPNGMCANTKYNSVGEATHIEYIKTTNCTEEKPPIWFSETRSPSVRGETFTRESTLANETYSYDTLGRLTEAQETPSGTGCTVRAYAYDEESNRTSLTTRAPGSKGECLTEGGTVENHTYDEANRMTDTGIEYDALGNIKKLPASDAEGHELTTTFYVSNAVASQTQNGVTNSYTPDPTGRVELTETGGKMTTSHYDAAGEAVAWTSESAEKWTRNIPGIDGSLCAVQTNGSAPVLQLHDLQGNVVATAALSKEATGLLSTYNSTEFGAPTADKTPPKYAWLGAGFVSDSLSSGVITYGATSYVPQTGRALQSEQVEPPGAPGGTGAGAAYTSQEEAWNMQGAAREGAEAPGLEAGREREAAIAAFAACGASGGCDPPLRSYFDAKEVAVMCGIIDAEDVAAVPLRVIELVGMKLSDLEKMVFWEVVKEVTGLHSPIEWADTIDSQLHACLKVMVSGQGGNLRYARCEITLPMAEIWFLELPNLFGMPSAEYCLYYKAHCGRYVSKNDAFLFPSGKWL